MSDLRGAEGWLKTSNNIYTLSFNNWWAHISSCDFCTVYWHSEDEAYLEQCEEGKRLEQIALKWMDKVCGSMPTMKNKGTGR